MKTKRILLHVLILVLAVTCLGTGMYVAYWESAEEFYADYEMYYNDEYARNVENVLDYSYAQSEMIGTYGDDSKILIENQELGNVTVGQIKEIFEDKYEGYFTHPSWYADLDDYEESFEYEDSDEEFTLYEMDKALMKTYKKQWKKNQIDTNIKDKYYYYKTKCRYVDNYAEIVQTLLYGMEQDGILSNQYDYIFLTNETYPHVDEGFRYYVKYAINGVEYTVSNASDPSDLSKGSMVDVTEVHEGGLEQYAPLYGHKDLVYGAAATDFLIQVTEGKMAVDTSAQTSNLVYFIEKAKEQLTGNEMLEIEENIFVCSWVTLGTLVVAIVFFILLMVNAGHREKGDEAQLYKSDRLWWDVIATMVAVAIFLEFWLVIDGILAYGIYDLIAIFIMVIVIPTVEIVIWLSESLMRRIKTKSFMHTTLFGIVWRWLIKISKKARKLVAKLWSNVHLTWKVILFGILFLAWELVNSYLSFERALMGIIVQVIVMTILVCAVIWLYFDENKKIKEAAKKIAEGDIDYKIEEKMKFSANESLKNSVNSIGDGLNAAIANSIKNERMKTELIANVSHDLKTPLTSIINYVDLLKTEGLDSENAKKYLDVLDQKSQRLKHLTEDLVEVSKLNSGVVNLQLEKIDIVQLVKQSLGEYAEKFKDKNLQIIKTIRQEPVYVMADGAKTWRLFENLYQNVYKYAMPGTRVYIDVKTEMGKAVISIKNISEGPLNFSADELMERFVRGDVSRTTEGSGLGLSIARSIAQRQNGNMNIILDGDLFKVEIVINLAE